jgi:hypothetical protein
MALGRKIAFIYLLHFFLSFTRAKRVREVIYLLHFFLSFKRAKESKKRVRKVTHYLTLIN